jgi:hypothetical protein
MEPRQGSAAAVLAEARREAERERVRARDRQRSGSGGKGKLAGVAPSASWGARGGSGSSPSAKPTQLASLVNPTRPQTAAILSDSRSLRSSPLASEPLNGGQIAAQRAISAGRRRPDSAAAMNMNTEGLLEDSDLSNVPDPRPISAEPSSELWQAVKVLLIRIRDSGGTPRMETVSEEVAPAGNGNGNGNRNRNGNDNDNDNDNIRLIADLDELNDLVRRPEEEATEWSDKQRSIVLKQVFKLVDGASAEVLARVVTCGAVVARIGTGAMLNVSKVAYKITKSDQNDMLARDSGLLAVLVDLMQRALASDPGSARSIECATFVFGALKNATNIDADNQDEVASLDGVGVCGRWLDAAMKPIRGSPAVPVAAHEQVISQTLVLLRNLAVSDKHRKYFTAAGTCTTLAAIFADAEARQISAVMLNASRILAKLTLFQECRLELLRDRSVIIRSLLEALKLGAAGKPSQLPIVVRLAFVLGNLTGASADARQALTAIPNAIDEILGFVESLNQITDSHHAADVDQALVKLVRVVANASIGDDVGPFVARRKGLSVMLELLREKSFEEHEELVLNVIGCITNISFYTEDPSDPKASSGAWNSVIKDDLEYSKLLVPFLQSVNEEVVIETVRAFGNFSRSPVVRQHLHETEGTHTLVMLLHHSNSEVVYNVCGVLMNVMAETAYKDVLANDGVDRLLELIDDSIVSRDTSLCTIVCKTLHNYCMETDPTKTLLTPAQMELAATRLTVVVESSSSGSEEEEEAKDIAGQLLAQLG